MRLVRSIAKPQYLFRPARCAARVVRELRGDRAQRVEVRLPWGVSIRINTSERVGRSIWRSGVHDLPVAEALWRLLDAGDLAIDVGANLGYTASLMARRVGRTGRVFCFEPQPEVFQELQENILLVRQARDVGEIEAHQIALSDRSGAATLVCGEEFDQNRGSGRIDEALPHGSNVRHLTVATRRLDDMIEERVIAVAKIDVEGHELAVLQGAERALASRRIEHIVYEDFGGPESPVHRLLGDCGYSVYGLGWATHKPVLTDVVQGPAIDLAWESPNYLATLAPRKALDRFRRWGWSVI
jgi:FkbM family methyltransferase